MKKKALLSSILTIALCMSLIAGSTFALFTSESKVDVSVTSGTVDVQATILSDEMELSSLGVAQTNGTFANGGTAIFDATASVLTLTNVTPGDAIAFTIRMTNNSNVAVQYRVKWAVEGELYGALVATADGSALVNNVSDWAAWAVPATDAEKVKDIAVTVELPKEVGNEYQNKTAQIYFTVEAVQGNAILDEVANEDQLLVALEMGTDIVLADDIVLSENTQINIAENAVALIDLNGHSISGSSDKNNGALIVNNGVLTIVGDGNGAITNDVVNGGAIIENGDNGTLVIDGANIVGAPIADGGYPAYTVYSTGDLTIEEGTTITADRGVLSVSGNTTINGGSFVVTNAADGRTLTLHTVYASGSGSVLTINGGNFENNYSGVSGASVVCPAGASISIYGGTFSDATDDSSNFNYTANIQNYMGYGVPVNVYGGTFDDNTVVRNVASGYAVTENDNGTWTVARVGVNVVTDTTTLNQGGEFLLATDVVSNKPFNNDTVIDLNGNTFEAAGTLNLTNNADLTMSGGDYTVNGTYGHVDVRPSEANGSVVTFEDVDFSYNKLEKTYGPSTNRLGTVVELCATADGAGATVVFKNCTFDNAQVLLEGMSGKVGVYDVTFENCTFNALTSSAPIYVQNYVDAKITVIGCTFNLTCTSSVASAISISSSSSTTVELIAENNTINAVAATPYTYDAAAGENETHNVKVNGTPANIKFISAYGNATVTEVNTVKSGIAA